MHDHVHPSATASRGKERRVEQAFALAVVLNVAYVGVEFSYGLVANSVALMADATHNLGDVLGLLLAWGANWLARREPAGRHTYGWQKSTILAALANALLLIGVTGGLVWEALERMFEPPEPAAMTMILVAALGVVINGVSALILMRSGLAHHHGGHEHEHDHGDVNLRGAFLHMAADAAVSVGVVITGAVLLWQPDQRWLDPAASLLIAAVIFVGTWSLLREAFELSLDAAPRHIDVDAVRTLLAAQPAVREVHDLHVWALGTRDVAMTAHLVVDEDAPSELLATTGALLRERFGIAHSTIQVESLARAGAADPCEQRC